MNTFKKVLFLSAIVASFVGANSYLAADYSQNDNIAAREHGAQTQSHMTQDQRNNAFNKANTYGEYPNAKNNTNAATGGVTAPSAATTRTENNAANGTTLYTTTPTTIETNVQR